MTLENVKALLLEKIAKEIESADSTADYFAGVYSTLCHADTQDKMMAAAIHGDVNPFANNELD